MLKKLDLYIIKKYLGTFFFSIVLIISISVVFDITEKIDDFHDNRAPLEAIVFDYYLNFIPYFANLFTPLFSFISVIFFTSKMAYNSEIVAILAGGVSFNRLLRPYAISAAVIGLMSFLLGAYVIPPANEKRLAFEDKYIDRFTSEVARNVQMKVKPDVVFYIERFDEKRNRGTNFSLEKFDEKHLVSRTTAKSVQWRGDSTWVLTDYLTRDFDGLYETITKGTSMDTAINVEPYEFFIESQHAPQMTLGELNTYLNKQKERGLGNTQAFADEYYKRISSPFAALILMVIGVSLSSRKVKGGMGLHIGVGIALSAIYILFTTISSVFAVKGSMPTLLAVWLPNIVFSVIGAVLYMRAPK